MKIDGREIASEILKELEIRVQDLKNKNITPHLVIILVGDDPASVAYVNQKKKKGESIGAQVTVHHSPNSVTEEELLSTIQQYNNDNNIHGIIVQRPLPEHIDSQKVNELTSPEKDVDAFHSNTTFKMPLAAAVIEILEHIFSVVPRSVSRSSVLEPFSTSSNNNEFISWLKNKDVVVIGKGETGGRPVIKALEELGIAPHVIDSKTINPEQLTTNADIIISTVGKPNIVKANELKPGVILVSVGMHRGEDGKLHGDYNEEEIKDIASFYTPVPGGVGPVNVAMLLKNLLDGAES